MPDDLRDQLDTAAQKHGGGWTLTDEVVHRLRNSFLKEREQDRDPALRAVAFLISAIARKSRPPVLRGQPWFRDPFVFRAFRLGVAKLLEALEPTGEIRPPKLGHDDRFGFLADMYETPEIAANYAVAETLRDLLHSDPLTKDQQSRLRNTPGLALLQSHFYGMSDARHHLGIDGPKESRS